MQRSSQSTTVQTAPSAARHLLSGGGTKETGGRFKGFAPSVLVRALQGDSLQDKRRHVTAGLLWELTHAVMEAETVPSDTYCQGAAETWKLGVGGKPAQD